MSIALHLSNYKANLCSSDCDVSNCSSHCDVCICSSQCDIHIYPLHCGVTMFGRLHCYYVRHLTMFGNAYHIGASVYVRHIVMLLCMVDGNITKFDTLRCLEMFVTLQRPYLFVTLRHYDVWYIASLPYSTHCDVWKCLPHCDVRICASHCNARKYFPYCNDRVMWDTLRHLFMYFTL
jgi:hypothetical protein